MNSTKPSGQDPDLDDILAALDRLGLLRGEDGGIEFEELRGGISSEIYRVGLPSQTLCVKRPLPTLKSDPDWHVPVTRSAAEFAWLQRAQAIVPGSVPAVLGFDPSSGLIVMEYLDPARYPNWKMQLRDGIVDVGCARRMAAMIAEIHNATAGDEDLAGQFDNDALFLAIRLEPYFLATAERVPAVAESLHALVRDTLCNKCALVHGDVSPKNLLIGPHGPVLLDAECAWYGDAAFDAAFCLTHLLLKCIWRPQWSDRYLDCFHAFAGEYLARAAWLPPAELELRISRLLMGLLLARVAGRSPVEYIDAAGRSRVQRRVVPLLRHTPQDLAAVAAHWQREFGDG